MASFKARVKLVLGCSFLIGTYWIIAYFTGFSPLLNFPGNKLMIKYCKFEIFARVYFRETSHMRSFVKITYSRIGKITLSFTDEDKSCHSHEFKPRKYVLTLFAKMKLSRKFPNLQ